jgi:hypothetical protein
MRALISLVLLLGLFAAATPPPVADQVLASGLYEDDSRPGASAAHPRTLGIPPAPLAAPEMSAARPLGAPLESAAPASTARTPAAERAPPAR